MALVMAIGILTVLAISGTTAVVYSTAGARHSYLSRTRQIASTLADSGINNAVAVLNNTANNALNPNLLPSTTRTYGGGSVTWSGTLDESNGDWSITSTATVASQTLAKRSITLTKTAKVHVDGEVIQTLVNPVWNYMFSTNTNTNGACDASLASGSVVSSNIYIYGNLCLNNNATITGANTEVDVRGVERMANSSEWIGTSGVPVKAVHIGGSCTVGSLNPTGGITHNPCKEGAYNGNSSGGDQIWANGHLDQTVPNISAPSIDWDAFYNNANPGPKYGCYMPKTSGSPQNGQSSWATAFDGDTTRNHSINTTFDLTPSSANYDCWSDGGELAWDSSLKKLTLNGTVFIDGPAKVSCTLCYYQGRGTLFLSGSFYLGSGVKFCAKYNAGQTDCDFSTGGWDPNAGPPNDHMIAIVSSYSNSGGGDQTGVSANQSVMLAANAHFQGALYAANTLALSGSVSIQGPMVSGTITFPGGGVNTYPFNINQVQSGLPGQSTNWAQPGAPTNYSG